MFNTMRRRLWRLEPGGRPPARARDASLQLRLPNPYGGKPWLTATVALTSTPHGHGETLRLRAHVDGCMRMPAGPRAAAALPADAGQRRSLLRYSRDTAAALVRRAVERLPAERLQPLVSKRWRSWLDIQLSTAPLDAGADALMPERLRGVYGGGLPRTHGGEPRVGVWAGPSGGPLGGVARLALLQIDERDVGLSRGERDSGFNLNACLAQVVEPDSLDDDQD